MLLIILPKDLKESEIFVANNPTLKNYHRIEPSAFDNTPDISPQLTTFKVYNKGKFANAYK